MSARDKLEWRYGMAVQRLSDGEKMVVIGQWRNGDVTGPRVRSGRREENLSPTEVTIIKDR